MNYTKLERSERMQQLLRYLRRAGKHGVTSMQLQDDLVLVAASTWVSMLRHNGHDVICRYAWTQSDGAKVYKYWLARYAPKETA